MKLHTLSLFVVGLILTSCKDLGVEELKETTPVVVLPSETEYYWAGGQKILLVLNRKTVVGFYKPDPAYPSRWLETMYFDEAQMSPLRSIVASRGFDPDQFEWLSFGYTGQGGEILPTNRIAFLLKSGYTPHSLDPLVTGEAVFDSTRFGTLMLKVAKQEGNVFDIANRVHESGLVEYCTPDFIIRITLPK
jgi:hypothetical protein